MQLFQRILRQFLQGNALTEEDAVDILSLKDNTEWPTDFVDALIILSNSQVGSHSVTYVNTDSLYRVCQRVGKQRPSRTYGEGYTCMTSMFVPWGILEF